MHKKRNPESVSAVVMSAHMSRIKGHEQTNAGLVALHGRPLLEYVVKSLRESRLVSTIIVVGPDQIDDLVCRRYIDRRIALNKATLRQLVPGEDSISDDIQQPLIVLCSDCVFLSSPDIDSFISKAQRIDADMVIPGIGAGHNECDFQKVDHRGKKYYAGLPVFVREKKFIISTILRTRELRSEAPHFLGSNTITNALASLHNRLLQPAPSERVLPVRNARYCLVPSSKEKLRYAEKLIKAPKNNRYRSIRMIVNPHAGQGMQMPKLMMRILSVKQRTTDRYSNIQMYVDKIRLYLAEFDIYPEIIFSKSAEDATRLAARSAAEGVSLVIAVGGDGSINSVANGLVGSNTAMAVIPVGTINLFAVQMGIPLSLRSSCLLIADGKSRRIDLGKVNGKYFTTVMGFGFDAQVIRSAGSKLKKVLGAASFIVGGIINVFTYPFHSIKISLDDDPRIHRGYLALLANGKYYGVHSIVSPDAELDDGKLDLFIFKRKGIGQLIRYLWGLRRGTLVKYGQVEYHQIRRMTVHGHTPIHLDGEFGGCSPVTIEDKPRCLKVIC